MVHEQKRFGFNLVFCELKGSDVSWKDFSNFAPADTAEEAVENLAKLLIGSTALKDQFSDVNDVRISKFELTGNGKRLLSFEVGNGRDPDRLAWLILGVGGMLGDPWKSMVFDDVNRELLDALIRRFPAQKQVFKGKVIEDALGL
jgi:hypothetical protein